ncbi:MAG: cobalamin biosynthesis protein CobW [Clostridiales bacterium]|nr:cobalamin biosynthesis protein CobW [Clostridiales bacterium]
MAKVKVDIFSGFLGAGKTTLIRKLIKEAYDEKLVLIENEFGEIGIDGGFLKDTGVQINEMNSGCICCTLVGDFKTALRQVIDQYKPERILIEPSGVGKLSDVIIAVQDAGIEEIELNGFTTVVDAKLCKMYMANFGEFYENQVEHASSVILSHTKGLSEEKIKECVDIIREHNDHASIVTTDWDELTGRQILDTMEQKKTLSAELDRLREEAYAEEEAHHHEHEHHHHDHEHEHEHEHDHDHHHHEHEHEHEHGHHHADEIFSDIGEETANKYTMKQIEEALEALQNEEQCGQILRAKGIVEGTDGQWIHFDYVPGEPEVRTGGAETTGMICVIGVDIKEDTVRELFNL